MSTSPLIPASERKRGQDSPLQECGYPEEIRASPTKIFKPIASKAEGAADSPTVEHSPCAAWSRAKTPQIGLTASKIANERIIAHIIFCNQNFDHISIETRGCQVVKTDNGVKIILNERTGKINFGHKGSFDVIQNTTTKELFFRRNPSSSARLSPGCCTRNWSDFLPTSTYVW